jgi:hypothetical protein
MPRPEERALARVSKDEDEVSVELVLALETAASPPSR